MTYEQYKDARLAFTEYNAANNVLVCLLCNNDSGLDGASITKAYPYNLSFDEIDVKAWVDASLEEIRFQRVLSVVREQQIAGNRCDVVSPKQAAEITGDASTFEDGDCIAVMLYGNARKDKVNYYIMMFEDGSYGTVADNEEVHGSLEECEALLNRNYPDYAAITPDTMYDIQKLVAGIMPLWTKGQHHISAAALNILVNETTL